MREANRKKKKTPWDIKHLPFAIPIMQDNTTWSDALQQQGKS